jgi:hypothetical protein
LAEPALSERKLLTKNENPHSMVADENEGNRINPGVLLFGSGDVFRRRSAHGDVETERSKIENYPRNNEIYDREV